MRFPLRLTAELAKAKMVGMGPGSVKRPIIFRVAVPADAGEESSTSPSTNSATDEEILKQVQASGAPIVWIGGTGEPLAYSGVGHLTRRIADLGLTVFVETDGVLLRRKIFSFRPVPRIFLTVQLNGIESYHDRHAGQMGTYRAAIEGIRAARLSGFMICAKTTVFEDTDLPDISELKRSIDSLALDGWMVTLGAGVSEGASLGKKLEAAWNICGGRWAAFSRLVKAAEEIRPVPLPMSAGNAVGEGAREGAYEQEVRVP